MRALRGAVVGGLVSREGVAAFALPRRELHIGGWEADATAGPLVWLPVRAPENGYWAVQLDQIYAGGRRLLSEPQARQTPSYARRGAA